MLRVLRSQYRFSTYHNLKVAGLFHRVLKCSVSRHQAHLYTFGTPYKLLVTGDVKLTKWRLDFVRNYGDLPPHTKVTLPALSPTMEQGKILSWSKKEGDKVSEGDLLADIETDKASMGFEASEEGYVAKILVPAGTADIPVGQLICIIVRKEEDIAAFKDFQDTSPPPKPAAAAGAPPAAAAPPPAAAPPAAEAPPAAAAPPATAAPPAAAAPTPSGSAMTAAEQRGERVYASPMAKKLAEAQKLRITGKGSGVYGSVKSTDLAGMPSGDATKPQGDWVATAPARKDCVLAPPGGHIDIPVTNIRSVIAKRLTLSKTTIPHYYVTTECTVDKLLSLRQWVNKKYGKQGVKLSVNDFIMKATAIACRKVPEANSHWMGEVIRQFDNIDVSFALQTPAGVLTPIVFGADKKGVIDISSEIKVLAAKGREAKLKPAQFQGGTICVSNLGMYGVTHFCAVINPPQACILAAGTTMEKLVDDRESRKGFRKTMVFYATLSADHRVIDGAIAAEWLVHFKKFMEDPETMIL